MAQRDQILSFLDDLLDAPRFQDHGPNGLQVPGTAEVSMLATGVSANRQTITEALAAGAQMVLCHHGLFWESAPLRMTEGLKGRLAPLLAADASLAAYHLPLDAHHDVGNNVLLCRLMGLEPSGQFAEHRGNAIGWVGRSEQPIAVADLIERLAGGLHRDPLLQGNGPDGVRSVGVVSGAAAGDLRVAIEAGLDAFLTGEPAEWAMAEATEAGIHFIAAGHYATETLGIRRLGQITAERFGLEHVFIDVPNPV